MTIFNKKIEKNKTLLISLAFFILSFIFTIGLVKIIKPVPNISDEYSYLLMADTFASKRLVNKPHKHWEFFETMQVLQQPNYQSKYMPAQGFVLFLGQILFGLPIYGIILFFSLAVASCFICLKLWSDKKSALVCTAFFMLHPIILNTLVLSYWGNIVSILAGFITYIGLHRLLFSKNNYQSLLFGLGISLLFLDRPFEGIASLVPAVILCIYCLTRKKTRKRILKRLILGAFLPVLITLTIIASYNKISTGNILTLPHLLYRAQYSTARLFVTQAPIKEKEYRHERMKEKFLQEEKAVDNLNKDLKTKIIRSFSQTGRYIWQVIPIPLILFIIFLVKRFGAKKPSSIWFMRAYGALALGVMPTTFSNFHYISPLLALIFISLSTAIFSLKTNKLSSLITFSILTLCLLLLFNKASIDRERSNNSLNIRYLIEGKLEKTAKKGLVFVKYFDNDIGEELVYNSANIDQQNIIWARYINREKNKDLIKYFKNRKVWITFYGNKGRAELVKPYALELN